MKPSIQLHRREFQKKLAGWTAGSVLASAGRNVLGANERIHLGMIGLGARGTYHLSEFIGMDDVEITMLSDCDSSHMERAAERLGKKVQTAQDFRRVLENREVDAVVIATLDHWHAIQMIMACQAGKDVYAEKPMGHTIHEQQQMIQAAEKTRRVVQVGMQQRSGKQFIQAVEWVKSGALGKISSVHCCNMWDIHGMYSDAMKEIGNPPDEEPPEGVDYDPWL